MIMEIDTIIDQKIEVNVILFLWLYNPYTRKKTPIISPNIVGFIPKVWDPRYDMLGGVDAYKEIVGNKVTRNFANGPDIVK